MARFLMNAMPAAGGYPWTVIRVEDRDDYLQLWTRRASKLTFSVGHLHRRAGSVVDGAGAPIKRAVRIRRVERAGPCPFGTSARCRFQVIVIIVMMVMMTTVMMKLPLRRRQAKMNGEDERLDRTGARL